MKRFTSLLIGCSMALAGVAMAQQPNEEASPGKKKKQGAEQTQPAQPKPNANVARPHATPVREHGAANEPGTGKGHKNMRRKHPLLQPLRPRVLLRLCRQPPTKRDRLM